MWKGKKNTKGKVIVAMSGGVDSSVVAALLKKEGYECIGVYMNFWTDPTAFEADQLAQFPQNKCCSLESANMARRIAGELDIPFYILNASEKFKKKVVDNFIDTYAVCHTPNPCVQCNKHIKFGFLLDRMKQLGADYIATGHFARVKKKKKKGKVVWELHMGKDKIKDQSYFLYTLTQEKLKHVLFPVGKMTKEKVKKLAEKFGFKKVAAQRESQGICFFPDKKYSDFLQRYFADDVINAGPIKTIDGLQIGTHHGLQLFTVGQRKGIDVGGEEEPLYVVQLDYKNNTLIVGQNKYTYQSKFTLKNLTFTEGDLEDGEYKFKLRIRYRFPPQKAVIVKKGDVIEVTFDEPQRAITPGQSVVFHERDRVIGGGIVDKVVYDN